MPTAKSVKYQKPALAVDQQLELLVRRGMIVNDRERALHLLSHISYYRLRAYWLPMEIPAPHTGDHALQPGVHFEHVVELYSFDRKLRLLVMDAIERVEVSLRTRWAYVLGLRYGSHAYENPDVFRDARDHKQCINNLKSELGRSHEAFVRHYQRTYTEPALPPLWAVCEVLSFGQLSQWFSNIKLGKDRQSIAEPFQVDEQIIKSFAHHLSYVRNVCAHHSRLWNREMTIAPKLPRRPQSLHESLNPAAPNRIYNTLTLLIHFMNIISPDSTWHQHVIQLLHEPHTLDLESMGFPADWVDRPLWRP
jgi:abortive infection bacteriophage resistance protein